MALPNRYEGRPLLLIIENYVLAAIGELPPDKHDGVTRIVQSVFGGDDDWMQTIRDELHWNATIDATILKNWRGYLTAAEEQGADASATEFAMMFADEVWKQRMES